MGMRSTFSSSSGSLPRLSRDTPAPQLKLKRMQVAPASLDPTMKGKFPTMTTSPTAGLTGRELEMKEKEINATKDFWRACWAGRPAFEAGLALLKQEKFGLKPDDVKFQSSVLGIQPKEMKACEVSAGVQKALKAGAKIDSPSDEYDGGTLLIKAVRCGELELAMWLLAKEADPTLMDRSGRACSIGQPSRAAHQHWST